MHFSHLSIEALENVMLYLQFNWFINVLTLNFYFYAMLQDFCRSLSLLFSSYLYFTNLLYNFVLKFATLVTNLFSENEIYLASS